MSSLTRAERQRYEKLLRTANDLVHVSQLVRGNIPPAVHAVVQMQPDGLPTGGDGIRSSEVSNPVLAAVLAGETGHRRIEALHRDLKAAYELLLGINDATVAMLRLTAEPAHQPAPGSGPCLIDDEWVSGQDPDRLKAGLCPRHHRAWCRWREEHRGDHQEFVYWARSAEAEPEGDAA